MCKKTILLSDYIRLIRFLAGKNDTHQTMAMCSDQGIWQPVNFECIFDPLAVNLKDGANYGKPYTTVQWWTDCCACDLFPINSNIVKQFGLHGAYMVPSQ